MKNTFLKIIKYLSQHIGAAIVAIFIISSLGILSVTASFNQALTTYEGEGENTGELTVKRWNALVDAVNDKCAASNCDIDYNAAKITDNTLHSNNWNGLVSLTQKTLGSCAAGTCDGYCDGDISICKTGYDCVGNQCVLNCAGTTQDCDGDGATCEDLMTDENYCGSCTTPCSGVEQCVNGVCCGDGACEGGSIETCSTCPDDCGVCPGCNNGVCEVGDGECSSCPIDCQLSDCCPNGVCDTTFEDCNNCSADCGACPDCPNGICDGTENCNTCPDDCGDCCGNSNCEGVYGENCNTCPDDCDPCCPDGSCNFGETCSTCSADCGACPVCPDGTCNGTENCNTCPDDCGCVETSGYRCVSGSCVYTPVYLNIHQGSCDSVCLGEPGGSCQSIGLDAAATDGGWWGRYLNLAWGACTDYSGTIFVTNCSYVFNRDQNIICGGYEAQWTKCRCYP
jgi:hypothetical protein